MFEPERVAVVGGTDREGSIGRAIMENLLESFTGEVIPVHPYKPSILGVRAVASVGEIDPPADLGIVVVPAGVVGEVVAELADAGVRDVVVISGGFAETGDAGRQRQADLAAFAEARGLNLVGPNSLGIINTANGLNATFAQQTADSGSISLMSQSGAFITAVLDWAVERGLGFRHVVSLGNEAVLDEVDFVTAWRDDPETTVVLGYVEDIGRGERFVETAAATTRDTPIVVLKSGRSAAGARAAASHTGALAGSDRAYDAAFAQAGIIRADSVQELFDYGRVLAAQPPLGTDGVAIVSNAGGPAVLAADAVARGPLELAGFSDATRDALARVLPATATVANPLDIIGDADLERFEETLSLVVADEAVGGVVVMACPTALFDHADLAAVIGEVTDGYSEPVIGCLMGGQAAAAASRQLGAYGIPNFFDPVRAVDSMAVLGRYRRIRRRRPDPPVRFEVDDDRARRVLEEAVRAGRSQVGAEAMGLLDAYGIRVPAGEVVGTAEAAERVARRVGGPVVMKIVSPDIVHKTDIGGVRVGVDRSDVAGVFEELVELAASHDPGAEVLGVQVQELVAVEAGVETIAGMTRDAQFGPLVMFGLGGIFVEVFEDVAFRLAPFGPRTARAMTGELRAAPLLDGVRGRPSVDTGAVADLLQRVGQLVTRYPVIRELDINPLIAGPSGAIAVDFRATLDLDRAGDPAGDPVGAGG